MGEGRNGPVIAQAFRLFADRADECVAAFPAAMRRLAEAVNETGEHVDRACRRGE